FGACLRVAVRTTMRGSRDALASCHLILGVELMATERKPEDLLDPDGGILAPAQRGSDFDTTDLSLSQRPLSFEPLRRDSTRTNYSTQEGTRPQPASIGRYRV